MYGNTLYTNAVVSETERAVASSRRDCGKPATCISESNRIVIRSNQEELHVNITAIIRDDVCNTCVEDNPSELRYTVVERATDLARNLFSSSQEHSNLIKETSQPNHNNSLAAQCSLPGHGDNLG